MRHRLFYVFLAAAVILAGCKGGKEPKPAEEEAVPETEQINET